MLSARPLRRLALAAVLAVSAAACSSDDEDDGAAADDAPAAEDGAFPVTLTHAFGETEIAEAPERVVTWGWGSADAAIALGVVPVAIPFADYGADEEGVLPWIRERLEADGAELPTLLPDTDEAPFEAIAAADPDVIIAAYSGITQEEYDLLSEIAPVVAYPGEAWATDWRELIGIVGDALGKPGEAAALLEDIDGQIAEQAAAHPELEGKSVAMVWDAAGTFYVYKPADARVSFTFGLGLESAPSVDELSTSSDDSTTFYFTLSYEQVAALESDILVSFADTPEQQATFLASQPAQLMTQVQEGRVAEVVGPEFISAVSPPTALSLTWGLEEYVSLLAGAAQAADEVAAG